VALVGSIGSAVPKRRDRTSRRHSSLQEGLQAAEPAVSMGVVRIVLRGGEAKATRDGFIGRNIGYGSVEGYFPSPEKNFMFFCENYAIRRTFQCLPKTLHV